MQGGYKCKKNVSDPKFVKFSENVGGPLYFPMLIVYITFHNEDIHH